MITPDHTATAEQGLDAAVEREIDATLVLANRIHDIVRGAGLDCADSEASSLCWEVAEALIADGTAGVLA